MLNIQSLTRFPVPKNNDYQVQISKKVESLKNGMCDIVLQEIDHLIYEMYGFDDSEIDLIESE